MMVTVAKSLDVPIKLIIPRADNPNQPGVAQFSMLGLGDIVLPGMMIGLALRYDLYRHYLALQKPEVDGDKTTPQDAFTKAKYIPPQKQWSSHFWTFSWFGSRSSVPASVQTGSFSKVYFWASVIGYTIGMVTTLVIMTWYKHAQPALLYLVPGVLLALGGTALVRGEVKQMWNFTEAEEVEVDEQKPSKSIAGQSMFSEEKAERNEAKIKKSISKYVQGGESEDEDEKVEKLESNAKVEKNESTAKVEKLEKAFRRDKDHDLVFFAISRHAPLRRADKEIKSAPKYTAHEETEVERPGKRQRIG
jgi:minor histocompatibility antigen H13